MYLNAHSADYQPTFFEAPQLATRPKWADGVEARKAPQNIVFNGFDRVHKVDRRSHEGSYAIVDGVPRCLKGPRD